jgi:hypothetical protein
MKMWVFLVQHPDDKEPHPVLYWGASELTVARYMVKTWPYRVSDSQELDVDPTVGKTEEQK